MISPIRNESVFTPSAMSSDQPSRLTRLSGPRRFRTTAKIADPSTKATASSAMINCPGRSRRRAKAHSSGWVIRLTASASPSAVDRERGRAGVPFGPHQPSTVNAIR